MKGITAPLLTNCEEESFGSCLKENGFGVVYREGLCREQAQVLTHEKFLPGKTTE